MGNGFFHQPVAGRLSGELRQGILLVVSCFSAGGSLPCLLSGAFKEGVRVCVEKFPWWAGLCMGLWALTHLAAFFQVRLEAK